MAIGAWMRAIDEWVEGPASLIGERWGTMRPGARVPVSISADGKALTLQVGRRGPGQEFPLSTDPADASGRALRGAVSGRGVSLAVPTAWVIPRTVEFPLEAAAHLGGIVASRVSSLSPVPAADTIHGHRVSRVDREARRMQVDIAILPRARVGDVLSALDKAGARDVAIEAPLGDGGTIRLDPRRTRAAGGRHRLRYALLALLGILVAGAAIALAAGMVVSGDQDQRRAALEARAEAARLAISNASTPEVADTAPKQAALDIKNRAVSVVGALEDLASALPRHSFATEITYADGRLRLGGRTMDLPDALTALESSGRFADSRPVGALTREEGGVFGDFVLETRPLIRTGGMLE